MPAGFPTVMFSSSRIYFQMSPNVSLPRASIYMILMYVQRLAHYVFKSPLFLPEVLQMPPDWFQHNQCLACLIRSFLASRGIFLKSSHISRLLRISHRLSTISGRSPCVRA